MCLRMVGVGVHLMEGRARRDVEKGGVAERLKRSLV